MEGKAHICLVVINGSDRPDHFSIGRVQPFKRGKTYTQKRKRTRGLEMVAHLSDNNMKGKKKKWVRNGGPVDRCLISDVYYLKINNNNGVMVAALKWSATL